MNINNTTLISALLVALLAIFKTGIEKIVEQCIRRFTYSLRVNNFDREIYMNVDLFLASLKNKTLNKNIHIRQEWDYTERKFSVIPSMNYGSYLTMHNHSILIISKWRDEKSKSFYPQDNIEVQIIGINAKKLFIKLKDFTMIENHDSELKIYPMKDLSYKYIHQRSLDNIFSSAKDEIINYVNTWVENKDFYYNHDIPYKAGIFMYGKPGTGKSSMVRALASYLSFEIHMINLNEYKTESELLERISFVPSNSIVLFEDIDCVVAHDRNKEDTVRKEGEENDSTTTKISLSTVFNILDGIISPENIIFIATSNHIEKLDQAMIRPGRFDCVVEMKYLEKEEAEEMISKFNVKIDSNLLEYPISQSKLQQLLIQKIQNNFNIKEGDNND